MIRRATPADAAALAEVGRRTMIETFREDFAIPYPPADLARFLDETHGAAAVAAQLADPARTAWLAERDGATVGYATIGPCKLPHPKVGRGDPELYQIYVTRAAQGAGLGRALLDATLVELERPGRPIWLGVWSGNVRAQRVYAARGFREVGAYRFSVGDWLDDELILRRDPPGTAAAVSV